jgi:hypothetical protein
MWYEIAVPSSYLGGFILQNVRLSTCAEPPNISLYLGHSCPELALIIVLPSPKVSWPDVIPTCLFQTLIALRKKILKVLQKYLVLLLLYDMIQHLILYDMIQQLIPIHRATLSSV